MKRDDISAQKKVFSSSQLVAQETGYTRDYIGQLCREGKLECERRGKEWFVERNSLSSYLEKARQAKRERGYKALRSSRKSTPAFASTTPQPRTQQSSAEMSPEPKSTSAFRFSSDDRPLIPVPRKDLPARTSAIVTRLPQHAATLQQSSQLAFPITTQLASLLQRGLVSVLVGAFLVGTILVGSHAEQTAVFTKNVHGSVFTEDVNQAGASFGALLQKADNLSFALNDFADAVVSGKLTTATALTTAHNVLDGSALFVYQTTNRLFETTQSGFFAIFKSSGEEKADTPLLTDEERAQIAERLRTQQEIDENLQMSDDRSDDRIAREATRTAPPTVIERPVIERVIERERVVTNPPAGGGFTEAEIRDKLAVLEAKLRAELGSLSAQTTSNAQTIVNNYTTISRTNKIDDLGDVTIHDSSITDSSFSGSSVDADSGSFDSLSVSNSTNLNTATLSGELTGTSATFSGDLTVNGTLTVSGGQNISGALVVPHITATSTATSSSIAYRLGIGTSSPYTRLGVAGEIVTNNITATSTSATSTFSGNVVFGQDGLVYRTDTNAVEIPSLTVTNATTTNATTTNLNVSSLTSATSTITNLTVTNSTTTNGTTTTAYIEDLTSDSGTITDLTATRATTTNATSTNLAVSGELRATNASATTTLAGGLAIETSGLVYDHQTNRVGIGTSSPSQTLTVSGNGYISGGLGIGVSTTTAGVLETSSNAYVGGNLTVLGDSVVFGNSTSDTLTISSAISSDLIPDSNAARDLGSPAFYWGDAYIDVLNANTISSASSTISGTQSADFTINTDNSTVDTEDMNLIFFRGNVVPNAVIGWDATLGRFDFNQPLFVQNDSSTTTVPTLDLKGTAGQTANVFDVASSSGSSLFSVTSNGNVGAGTDNPSYKVEVNGGDVRVSGLIDASRVVATSSSESSTFAGTVGIGTSTPSYRLEVDSGDVRVSGLIDASHFVGTSSATSTLAGGIEANLLNITTTGATSTIVHALETGGLRATNGLTVTAGGVDLPGNVIDNAELVNDSVSYGGVSVSLGGSDATPAFDLTDATSLPIDAGTTGTLPISRGGTGQTSFTNNTILTIDNSGAFTSSSTISSSLIEDSYVLNTGDTITGTLTFSGVATDITTGTDEDLVFSPNGTGNSIFSSGSVGIGTTSPSSFLTISDSDAVFQIDTTSAGYPKLQFSESGAPRWTLEYATDRNNLELFNHTTSAISFIVDDESDNIGIGTTTPWKRLSVSETVSDSQFSISYDDNRYANFQVDSTGDLIIDPQGDDVFLNDDNLWVCTGGSCPAGSPSGTGNLVVENELGVGTSSPSEQFSVANNIFIGNGGSPALGTATSTFQGDIIIRGKLDVGTIDPVYTIDGTKYATYGHSTVGIKEETVMKVTLAEYNEKNDLYEYTIDFDTLEEGTDTWLFYQISNFGENWENLVTTVTAGFPGSVYFEEKPDENKLIIQGTKEGLATVRLIADRYDSQKWPNLRPDQNEGYEGHIIKSKQTPASR